MESKHNNPAGRNCGKGVSHRLQEIDDKFKKSGGIFKEYKIGELFEKKTIKGVPKKEENLEPVANGYYMFGQNIKYQYPFKIKVDDKYLQKIEKDYPILAYTSSVGEIGMITESFYRSGNNGAFQGLFPKHKFTYRQLLYIQTLAQKYFKSFGYATSMKNILDLKITLPTLNNELAFEYMEERIRELESERIRELEAYLQATGLNNYILDENDRGRVNRLIENKIELKEYKVGDLFEVKNNPQLNKEHFIFSDKGQYPYFTRTVANNGILGYVEYLNEKNKITGNSIAVGMLCMQFFYMEKDFYAGQFTKTIYPKFKYFNEKIALYFTSLFNLHSKRYQGVLVRNFEHTFLNTKIYLPTLNNNIDFNYMAQLIKTLEKIIIKDVIDFKDKIIKTHKEICRI